MRKMTAVDGTVFGVFNQGNGDYVAAEDEHGSHHAPRSYQLLPTWSDAVAHRHLREAVAEYNRYAEEEGGELEND